MDTDKNQPPKYTNRLIHETSPYLLQHAHNPVDWYPWGEEALAKARTDDKPILLSIGYSACHWCHVMEHESFENEAIARLMNDHFVCIKVDREERPDLDQIYMNSVQMMTGQGGWPMTVFLTPAGAPFFGGTYFPPEDRHGMSGFPRVLTAISETYRQRREQVLQNAAEMTRQLQSINRYLPSNELLTTDILQRAWQATLQRVDPHHGGFGPAPKFPNTMSLELLLLAYRRHGRREIVEAVQLTLDKMAGGGIYDHLGGGFHRYSVDARWLVPHFEKMLYDNALLSEIYLQAFQLTGNARYGKIVEETLDYILREMTSPQGGFYSTQDADSEGHEGKFFLWTLEEVRALLGPAESEAFCQFYDISEKGNFEGKNILNIPQPLDTVAAHLGLDSSRLQNILTENRKKLFSAREARVKPGRDEKILTGWNGLMLKSFAKAAQALDRADYRQAAVRNAEFLLTALQRQDRLCRSYKDGEARFNAYLEDYAYLIDGLLALYASTFEIRWLVEASRLAKIMIEQFWDEEGEGFYFTGKDHEALISRPKEVHDGAIPSPTAVAVDGLLRLGILLGNPDYEKKAATVFRCLRDSMWQHPTALSRLMTALELYLGPRRELALVGRREDPALQDLRRAIQSGYYPLILTAWKDPDDPQQEKTVPWLRERGLSNGRSAAYICENYVCQAPITDAATLVAALEPPANS